MKSILSVLLMLAAASWAAEPVGLIKNAVGDATMKRETQLRPVEIGEYCFNGDVIQTGKKSNIALSFHDGTRIALGPNTTLVIDDYVFEPYEGRYNFQLNLQKGRAVFSSGKIGKLAPKSVKVKVPQGVIGIRGTKFVVEAE